ncbi:MAG: ABC transporter substrate-binding protein [Oscillospiraceae bacterium]|nr:ABC transporter substrate-binding protein [Oscillospiraceae bacterium]
MRRVLALALALLLFCGCGAGAAPAETAGVPAETEPAAVETARQMELRYAEQFRVDYRADGSALLTVAGDDRFLIVPEGWTGEADCPVLRQGAGAIYVAATSAMDLFVQLGALGKVGFTSTTQANWGLPELRESLDTGALRYVGKYSAPDYELLLSEGCSLAVESTMIYHSPEVQEKLEALGVPVLVERSSYEPHPLGRVEWIKLYGLLLGLENEAAEFFDRQAALLEELDTGQALDRSVAFFHISSTGAAVVRKPGDYVTKLIELAGGRYVFDELPGSEDSSLSTMNMQMEAFYAGAKDADVLIYNSAIDGELETLSQLLEKNALLADFRAVQNGEVWCTEHNMFQKSSAAAGMIGDFNAILRLGAEAPEELGFLHRLR